MRYQAPRSGGAPTVLSAYVPPRSLRRARAARKPPRVGQQAPMDYPVFACHWRGPDLIVCQQRRGFLLGAPWPLLSQADLYRLAMRLIEQHGDGAEIAARDGDGGAPDRADT